MDTRKYRAEPRSIYDYQPGKSSVLNNEKMVMFVLSWFVALSCDCEILPKCLPGSMRIGFLMLASQCSCDVVPVHFVLKTVLHNFLTFLFSTKQDPGAWAGSLPSGCVVFCVKYGSLTRVFNPRVTL